MIPGREKETPNEPRILSRPGAPSIAYHRTIGRAPGVLFLTGFMSDMTGNKALALEAFCRARGHAFVRFDYRGHGASGGAFDEAHIGTWLDDALAVFDRLTEGPQILVGSSMGGWLMLLMAKLRAERIAGLVGIAAAPDFTERLAAEMTPEHRAEMASRGRVVVPSIYGSDYVFTRGLIEAGAAHCVLNQPIPFDGPVRLIQGVNDHAVSVDTAFRIQAALTSKDVEVILVEDGDHRLSRDQDLERLASVVGALLDKTAASPSR